MGLWGQGVTPPPPLRQLILDVQAYYKTMMKALTKIWSKSTSCSSAIQSFHWGKKHTNIAISIYWSINLHISASDVTRHAGTCASSSVTAKASTCRSFSLSGSGRCGGSGQGRWVVKWIETGTGRWSHMHSESISTKTKWWVSILDCLGQTYISVHNTGKWNSIMTVALCAV